MDNKGSIKFFGPENFGLNIFFGPNNFGQKNFWGSNMLWVQNIWDQERSSVQKNFVSKKCGQTNWIQCLGSQNNCVQKILPTLLNSEGVILNS